MNKIIKCLGIFTVLLIIVASAGCISNGNSDIPETVVSTPVLTEEMVYDTGNGVFTAYVTTPPDFGIVYGGKTNPIKAAATLNTLLLITPTYSVELDMKNDVITLVQGKLTMKIISAGSSKDGIYISDGDYSNYIAPDNGYTYNGWVASVYTGGTWSKESSLSGYNVSVEEAAYPSIIYRVSQDYSIELTYNNYYGTRLSLTEKKSDSVGTNGLILKKNGAAWTLTKYINGKADSSKLYE